MLGRCCISRLSFFGERSNQFRGCALVGLVCVGDVTCPSACCIANVCGGLPGEIVDAGESGPPFVTKSGPMLGGGMGDPGGSGVAPRSRASKKPGVDADALGMSGASLVSRECVTEPGRETESMESDAKGSSPTREDVLAFAVPAPPRNELGGGRPAAPLVFGPMTSSTMLLVPVTF